MYILTYTWIRYVDVGGWSWVLGVQYSTVLMGHRWMGGASSITTSILHTMHILYYASYYLLYTIHYILYTIHYTKTILPIITNYYLWSSPLHRIQQYRDCALMCMDPIDYNWSVDLLLLLPFSSSFVLRGRSRREMREWMDGWSNNRDIDRGGVWEEVK